MASANTSREPPCSKCGAAELEMGTCPFGDKCRNGKKCPRSHVCWHFLNGNCKYGANCKNSHSLPACTHGATTDPPVPAVSAPSKVPAPSSEQAVDFDLVACLYEEMRTLSGEYAMLQNRYGALVWILRKMGMTQADIDKQVTELTTMPDEEEP